MRSERFVVLGLARARAQWFADVSEWAGTGRIAMEFVKCVSIDEVLARVDTTRATSAVLVDGGAHGVDRDAIEQIRRRGIAVIIVASGPSTRDWHSLGASSVLDTPFSRETLTDVLGSVADAVPHRNDLAAFLPADPATDSIDWRGRLVGVVGTGGVGASTVAIAIAQFMAAHHGSDDSVCLADLALTADQAMLHDVGDVIPGVLELVDAHRHGIPDRHAVREHMFAIDRRGYHLLLGLRRRSEWTAMRQRAFEAAIDSLLRTYAAVVADIDNDLDGVETTGSTDIGERNMAARHVAHHADVVVAVGVGGLKGTHALVRLVSELLDHGVEAGRIIAVMNRAPGSARLANEMRRTLLDLLADSLDGRRLAMTPLCLSLVPKVESAHHRGLALPARFVRPIGLAVSGTFDSLERDDRDLIDGAARSHPSAVEFVRS